MTLPAIKDWKTDLDKRIAHRKQTGEDILAVIHECQDALEAVRPAYDFVIRQHSVISEWMDHYARLYTTRFAAVPPPRAPKDGRSESILDTPEKRKQAIRETALSLTKPGAEVTDKAIHQALNAEGKRIVARNPTATISTILTAFTSDFEKVSGKRGVFKRRDPEVVPQ
jgi:hypothetical protein